MKPHEDTEVSVCGGLGAQNGPLFACELLRFRRDACCLLSPLIGMPERKGPTPSATLFSVGATQRGNDGRMWRVAVTKAGVRRWCAVPERTACPVTGGRCECPSGGRAVKKELALGKSEAPARKARIGPTASATLYEVGTRKKGNDGHMWTVSLASNGVQRWARSPASGGKARAAASGGKARSPASGGKARAAASGGKARTAASGGKASATPKRKPRTQGAARI